MARIVLISPYLKGGQNAAKLAQRTRYVATRPGVELLADERSTLPATKKQQDFIARLLKSFPSCWELIEYEEYLDHPTQGNASAFIQQVREDYMEALDQKENFIDYISHRPGVQKDGEHGLWDAHGKVQNLARAVREVAEHTGNVWTPVVALRREDAERLGYDNAENWQALVNASICDIAKAYKIRPENLRWYAAFHQKPNQVHINMIILSHATMPDRTQAILTGNKLPFLKAITQDARDLEMLGVENIAIPCNTSHYFLEDIQKSTSVPIINMVEESVRYVVEAHPKVKKIGIMGTDGTMQAKT